MEGRKPLNRHWWGGKKKSEEGYQPTGDSISWDIAMSQAITALDHSAELAIKTKSPGSMREVAVGWLAVANTLTEASSELEESELSSQEGNDEYPKVGFMGAPMRTAPVDDEIDEEEEEEYEQRVKRSKVFHLNRRTPRQ